MEAFGRGKLGSGAGGSDGTGHGGPEHADEWAEMLARTVAHLAAQLTLAQLRLRALATELAVRGTVDEGAVMARVRDLAAAEADGYLRENLGEPLADLIDTDTLRGDLVAYLQAEADDTAASA